MKHHREVDKRAPYFAGIDRGRRTLLAQLPNHEDELADIKGTSSAKQVRIAITPLNHLDSLKEDLLL